jgi:hypothetical protein
MLMAATTEHGRVEIHRSPVCCDDLTRRGSGNVELTR